MELTIESIRSGDRERHHALMRQAFGGDAAFDPDAPRTDPDKFVCAYLGDQMVGSVLTFDFAMTWGGRRVRCGGLSGVVVSPQVRGRGAAQRMLTEALRRMHDGGQVVSALYPTTATLYRRAGYEIVGFYRRRRVPVGAIEVGEVEPLDWREVDPASEVLADLYDDMAGRFDGWFRVDPQWWGFRSHRQSRDAAANRFTYVGSRAGSDVAAVQYRYEKAEDFYDLEVEVLAGLDNGSIGAALGLLAGHGTTAGHAVTAVPSSVLGPHVPQLQRTSTASDWPWMLRLVDAPGAIAARGWPTSVSGTVELDIADDRCTGNAGAHVLEIGGGQASLLRGGSGRVRVTIQDLAVLYAGGDVAALRSAGRLVEASAGELDLLATAFVSHPSIPLFF
jgi:predicted acetyltransferase